MKYGKDKLNAYYLGELTEEDRQKRSRTVTFRAGQALELARGLFLTVSSALNDYDVEAEVMFEQSKAPYGSYLQVVEHTFSKLLSMNKKVFFVCQPDRCQSPQQQLVRELIAAKFQDTIVYFNLENSFSVQDYSFDGMHPTGLGNGVLAAELKKRLEPHLFSMPAP